jgi:hypothetical protein
MSEPISLGKISTLFALTMGKLDDLVMSKQPLDDDEQMLLQAAISTLLSYIPDMVGLLDVALTMREADEAARAVAIRDQADTDDTRQANVKYLGARLAWLNALAKVQR